jgi:hypothetical protein
MAGIIGSCLKITVILALTCTVFTCGSCLKDIGSEANLAELPDLVVDRQGFVDLPWKDLPDSHVPLSVALQYLPPLDVDSIEMFSYRGQDYYHPIYMSQRCLRFVAAYREGKDTVLLKRAEQYAKKLMSLCEVEDGMAWAPYTFRYAVHGDSSITMEPPWYSGMAQGVLLETLMRLYETTGDSAYLEFSEMVFKTLLRKKDDDNPWVAQVDSFGYYWIEEYPHPVRPGYVLNGFIAATFGVYDYYRLTGDPLARRVWDIALTTVKTYADDFRRDDQSSYYCLGHRHPANSGYHNLHITLFEHLARMAGDSTFANIASQYRSDTDSTRAVLLTP